MTWAKALGAAVAVLALVALTAGSASAATALELKYEEAGILKPVVPGMTVEAKTSAWALETPQGNVSCTQQTAFDGTVGVSESNGQKKDKVSVTRTQGRFFAEECENTTPIFGRVLLVVGNLITLNDEAHGTFELGDNGKATYTTAGPFETVVQLQYPEAAGGFLQCTWEVKKLNGTEGAFPGD